MDQSTLAALACVDISTISKIETSDREPSREMVFRIGKSLVTTDGEWELLFHMAGYLTPKEWNMYRQRGEYAHKPRFTRTGQRIA
jgi:transcriptional regulator with XRE-family HTH domain